jgi:hypothetical protein
VLESSSVVLPSPPVLVLVPVLPGPPVVGATSLVWPVSCASVAVKLPGPLLAAEVVLPSSPPGACPVEQAARITSSGASRGRERCIIIGQGSRLGRP